MVVVVAFWWGIGEVCGVGFWGVGWTGGLLWDGSLEVSGVECVVIVVVVVGAVVGRNLGMDGS